MNCQRCGNQLPGGADFCPVCGMPCPHVPEAPASGGGSASAPFAGSTAASGSSPYATVPSAAPGPVTAPPMPGPSAPPPKKNTTPLVIGIVAVVVVLLAASLVAVLVAVPKGGGERDAKEEEHQEQDANEDARDDEREHQGLSSASDVADELTESFVPAIESSFDIEELRGWSIDILDLMPPEVMDALEAEGYSKDDIADAFAGAFISSGMTEMGEYLDYLDFEVEFYVSGPLTQDDIDTIASDLSLLGLKGEITDGKSIGMRVTAEVFGQEQTERLDKIGYCAIEIDDGWFFWTITSDGGLVTELPEDVEIS